MASILPVGDRWRAQVRRAGHKSIARTFDTRREAETWARRVETGMDEHRPAALGDDMRVETLVSEYRRMRATLGRAVDPCSNVHYMLEHLAEDLGPERLRELTPQRLSQWAQLRKSQGAGGYTVNMELSLLGTAILRDIEMVSGAQDASRGGVNQAKTATEAEIMAMGMQSRTSEQLDTIEDWLTAILAYCAQLLLLNLTPEQVQAKFGKSAVWPELSKKELFEQVMVQIRAGSTSKPNKMRERDQWLQFLPQLQEAIAKIAELRDAGMDDMAEAMVKVLDETLRRFDERLSIKEFIPGMEDEEGPDQQDLLKQAKGKIMQMTQEAEAALAEQREALSQQEEALAQRETALQVKEIQQRADAEVASIRDQYDEAMRKVKDREAANAVTEKVQQLLQQHEQRVQQMLAGPDPQQQLEEMRASLLDEVQQLMSSMLAQQEPAEPAAPDVVVVEGMPAGL